MQKFLILLLTALTTVMVHGQEGSSTDIAQEAVNIQPAAPVETPVMMLPSAAPVLAETLIQYPSAKPSPQRVKKAKAAKLAQAKGLLSRSVREQINLGRKQGDDPTSFNLSEDDDDERGLDELDLHRFYNRPKLVDVAEPVNADDDDADLPAHITLRLFMARTKAVEAHILAHESKADQGNGDELSDTVKQRLREAREKAVAAFIAKHGET